jgi:hypothetical protein
MAEADVERPEVPHVPIPIKGRPLWVRGMACLAILPLLGFIGQTGHRLWGEYCSLQQDQVSVRASQLVGYVNINPSPNFASCPSDWMHDEGGSTLLWARWLDGEHHWYRLGIGEIVQTRISTPMGQDVIRAIDTPLFEMADGPRWGRVADEARVASFTSGETAIAYPWTILDKVEMVNEMLGDRPIFVAYTPLAELTTVFDAVVDGKRITFGHSGYFFNIHPIFYDRGTESLWTERDGEMVAFAGSRKGAKLKRIAQLDFVAWSSWKVEHPQGLLLVGADRSKPRPTD